MSNFRILPYFIFVTLLLAFSSASHAAKCTESEGIAAVQNRTTEGSFEFSVAKIKEKVLFNSPFRKQYFLESRKLEDQDFSDPARELLLELFKTHVKNAKSGDSALQALSSSGNSRGWVLFRESALYYDVSMHFVLGLMWRASSQRAENSVLESIHQLKHIYNEMTGRKRGVTLVRESNDLAAALYIPFVDFVRDYLGDVSQYNAQQRAALNSLTELIASDLNISGEARGIIGSSTLFHRNQTALSAAQTRILELGETRSEP